VPSLSRLLPLILGLAWAAPAAAALVEVRDIATGALVADYEVPPIQVIALQPGQQAVFADVRYGDPANPNVYLEIIEDAHLLVTLPDGSAVVIGNLVELLLAGEEAALAFADSGESYHAGPDGTGGIEIPVFDELEDFPMLAAGAEAAPAFAADSPPRSNVVRASRAFEGPHQFPPYDVAAYGIVAFPFAPAPQTRARYLDVCRAYLASLPYTADLTQQFGVPRRDQMITVWPVETGELATALNASTDAAEACDGAVDGYHLPTALQAIRDAEAAGYDFAGDSGPLLIAWAPASEKGAEDAVVLVANLSCVNRFSQLTRAFGDWRSRIEENPALWRNGWVEAVRTALRMFFDCNAPIVSLIGGGE
jgi:hypothetical protein